jgi:NAD(P)-dependent dehydrogenase (short-subunit alcohol dehydrogenase family)
LHSDIKIQPHITTLPEYNGKDVPDLREYKGSGKLAGKAALITGGDSGIGRAVAVLFAREGCDVAINYLPKEQSDAEEVKKAIEAEGRKCVLIPQDIRGEEVRSSRLFRWCQNCKKIVEEAKKGLGEFQILINNAATQLEQPSLLELSAEQLQDTFNTNIFSMFYITKATLPHLKRGAAIVNCASVNHYAGHPKLLE